MHIVHIGWRLLSVPEGERSDLRIHDFQGDWSAETLKGSIERPVPVDACTRYSCSSIDELLRARHDQISTVERVS